MFTRLQVFIVMMMVLLICLVSSTSAKGLRSNESDDDDSNPDDIYADPPSELPSGGEWTADDLFEYKKALTYESSVIEHIWANYKEQQLEAAACWQDFEDALYGKIKPYGEVQRLVAAYHDCMYDRVFYKNNDTNDDIEV